MDDIRDDEWIRPGQAQMPKKREPKVDKDISDIVGKAVYVNDPRLVQLVNEFRTKKTNVDAPDNYTKNPVFVKKLKQVFS